MINFHSIKLKDVLVYKEAELRLDAAPITVIHGKNMDAGGSANGAGKTVLFSAGLVNLRYFEPPMANKRNSAKDFLHSKSKVQLSVSNGDTDWNIEQFGKKSGVGLKIEKNEQPLRVRRLSDAKARLSQIIPYNIQQFNSILYLNGRDHNVIQMGSGPARHSMFESLFQLHLYERIYRETRKYLNLAREAKNAYRTLKDELKEEVSGDPEALKTRISFLKDNVAKHQQKMDGWQHDLHKINNYLYIMEDVFEDETDIPELADCKEQLEKLEPKIDKLQKQLRANRGLVEAWNEYRRYRKQIEQLETELQNLPKIDSTKIKKLLDKLEKKQDALHEKLSERKGWIEQQRETLKTRLQGLKHGKNCVVCGSDLSDGKHAKLHKKTLTEMKEIEDTTSLDKMRKLRRRISDKQDSLKERLEKARRRDDIVDRIQRTEKVRKPDEQPVDEQELEKTLESLKNRQRKIQRIHDALRKLAKLDAPYKSAKEAKGHQDELKTKINKMKDQLQEDNQKLHILEGKYYRLTENLRHQKKVRKLLSRQKKKAKNFPVYEALSEAYGPRGLRIGAIKTLANLYVKNLNKYASTVFMGKYEFSVEVENREFRIMVKRAKKQVSDIRYLSGAESRSFALLSLISLLPLLPANLRSNLVVLDEMEANMSPQNRALYATEFLPLLNKIVPHIFIVTPLPSEEMYIANARHITAVMKNGVTKLIDGKP